MAYEIHKIAGVMNAVVFADGALEAKNDKSWAVCRILMGSRSEKIAIGTAKRAI